MGGCVTGLIVLRGDSIGSSHAKQAGRHSMQTGIRDRRRARLEQIAFGSNRRRQRTRLPQPVERRASFRTPYVGAGRGGGSRGPMRLSNMPPLSYCAGQRDPPPLSSPTRRGGGAAGRSARKPRAESPGPQPGSAWRRSYRFRDEGAEVATAVGLKNFGHVETMIAAQSCVDGY
jgi:hypothetical protein